MSSSLSASHPHVQVSYVAVTFFFILVHFEICSFRLVVAVVIVIVIVMLLLSQRGLATWKTELHNSRMSRMSRSFCLKEMRQTVVDYVAYAFPADVDGIFFFGVNPWVPLSCFGHPSCVGMSLSGLSSKWQHDLCLLSAYPNNRSFFFSWPISFSWKNFFFCSSQQKLNEMGL